MSEVQDLTPCPRHSDSAGAVWIDHTGNVPGKWIVQSVSAYDESQNESYVRVEPDGQGALLVSTHGPAGFDQQAIASLIPALSRYAQTGELKP